MNGGVLYLTPTPYWRPGAGSHTRVAAMIRALRTSLGERGTPLCVCSIAPRGHEVEAALARPSRERPFHLWIDPGPQPPYPGRCGHFGDEGLRAGVRRVMERVRPEAILCDYVTTAQALPHGVRDRLRGVRLVVDTHDVMHERAAAFDAFGKPHWLKISLEEEAAVLARFDAVVAIQEHDARTFNGMLDEHARRVAVVRRSSVIVAPHGLPLERIEPMPVGGDGVVRVGFIGSAAEPNRVAARRLVERVWPRVRERAGEAAELMIVGEVGRAAGLTCDEPRGVRVFGPARCLRSFYASADVIANPVEFGGGLKIKSVEAMAFGRPLVATAEGLRGLEGAVHAGAAFSSEADAALADAIARLCTDAAAREKASHAARSYAERHHDARSSYASLVRALSGSTAEEGDGRGPGDVVVADGAASVREAGIADLRAAG